MSKELQSKIVQFGGRLLLFLFPGYWFQLYIYSKYSISVDNSLLQLSYLVNGLLVVFIFVALMLLKKKYKEQLGFLYMFGSLLKFGVFFIVFYPTFKADGEVSKIEFSLFFIPYLISLLIETVELIKILNTQEDKEA